MHPVAQLIELFPSIQGEGAYVGSPQVFVRFHGCSLSCGYCDTPATHRPLEDCRIFPESQLSSVLTEPNPLSPSRLTDLIARCYADHSFFSLTGGEPLEQADFLKAWLPGFKPGKRILLETAGVHTEPLKKVLPWIDVISMDLKPQSATGMRREFWPQHRAFLKTAAQNPNCTVYAKVVIDESLKQEEETALEALMQEFPIEYYFQPITPFTPASLAFVLRRAEHFSKRGHRVRFLPQLHPLLGLK